MKVQFKKGAKFRVADTMVEAQQDFTVDGSMSNHDFAEQIDEWLKSGIVKPVKNFNYEINNDTHS